MNVPLAVIGGSGAYDLLKSGTLGKAVECRTVNTPFGPGAPVHRFSVGEFEFLFISRHGEADYSITAPYVNYRANIYALKECGVERIVSWSGPGIITAAFRPGEFALPHDIIDETRKRESTFFKNRGHGFIRQKDPFCPQIRSILHDTFHNAGLSRHEQGVYVCTEGPRLETPAEIRKFRILGADMVGMTLAPEAFLARELEVCYAPVCYLTNYAEGVEEREFAEGILFEGMMSDAERSRVEQSVNRFPSIIRDCFALLRKVERVCQCKNAMRRYKNKNRIGEDWHGWIGDV